MLARFVKARPVWQAFIAKSFLPEVLKDEFYRLLERRFAQLGLV